MTCLFWLGTGEHVFKSKGAPIFATDTDTDTELDKNKDTYTDTSKNRHYKFLGPGAMLVK